MNLRTAIVRILKEDDSTVGTGFIVSESGLIATCAHVIAAAGAGPGDAVRLAFHATGEIREAIVEPAWWRVPDAEDVAILRSEGTLPSSTEPLILGSSKGAAGHPFVSFGYPDIGGFGESPAEGTILGLVTHHPNNQQVLVFRSQQISPGMSGAPILDTVTRRVVGIVNSFPAWQDGQRIVAGDIYGRHVETNYATPSETLRDICPSLRIRDICPYRHLNAFTEADAEFFFGREQIVAQIVNRLKRQPRFVAVLGPSGSGKSSLVQAGVVPELRRGAVLGSDHWHIILITPGENPFFELDRTGIVIAGYDLANALEDWQSSQPPEARLAIVIDQFEELFTLCSKSVREAFIRQLSILLDKDPPITVMLTMRSDFYNYLAEEASDLLSGREQGIVNIPLKLTRQDLANIIQKPAKLVGISFEQGLVETIVDDALEQMLGQKRGITGQATILPLLEVALTRLWEYQDDGLLTYEAYRKQVGGVTAALNLWADEAYYGLDISQRQLARRIFTELVHLGEETKGLPISRQRCTLDQLCRHPSERKAIHIIVNYLADKRLLITGGGYDSTQEGIEIIHDTLLHEWAELQRWLTEDWEFILWRQRLQYVKTQWEQSGCDEGALLRGAILAEAEQQIIGRYDDLRQDERKYLYESLALRAREAAGRAAQQQRELEAARNLARSEERRASVFRIATIIASILTAIALVLGYQWRQSANRAHIAQQKAEAESDRANEQARTALSRQLAAEALNLVEEQYDLSVLLSLEAYNTDNSIEAQRCIHTILERKPYLKTFLRIDEGALSLAFSPDGKTLVSGGDAGVVIWDVETYQRIGQSLPYGHQVALSPDGQVAASGDENGFVTFWDVATGQTIGEPILGHTDRVWGLAFSPDGKTLASAGLDHAIILWDVATRKPIGNPLKGHTARIHSIAFSPDGRTLASGSSDNTDDSNDSTLIVWDTGTGRPIYTNVSEDELETVWSVAFSPYGQTLATGYENGAIILWDIYNRHVVDEISKYGLPVSSVAFSPDGQTLAAAQGNTIRLWDVSTGQLIREPFEDHANAITILTFSPDGNTLASASADRTIILWDLTGGPRLGHSLVQHTGRAYDVDFSPDNRILTSVGEDGRMILWDVASGQPIGEPFTNTEVLLSVAFSPDGQVVAMGSEGGDIILWSVAGHRCIGDPLTGHRAPVFDLAFRPDGKMLVTVSDDGTLILWDVEARQSIVDLHIESYGKLKLLPHISFSPDGKILAMNVGSSRSIILWNVETKQFIGNPIVSPVEFDVVGMDVAFSPDSALIAFGNTTSQSITLWDVNAKQPIGKPLVGHVSFVTSVAFSPDGQTLASGSLDNTVILWDIATQQPLYEPLTGHTDLVQRVIFSSDGKTLASSSADGTIILWNVDLDTLRSQACHIVNRNLTQVEWERHFPNQQEYRRTCPDFASDQITETIETTPPTPTPSPTIEAASTKSVLIEKGWSVETNNIPDGLSLEFPAIIQCRESGDSDQLVQDYVVAWLIRVEKSDEWVSNGEARIIFGTSDKAEFGQYPIRGFSLAANEIGWLMSRANYDGFAMSGGGTEVDVFQLVFDNVTWESVDKISTEYGYEVDLLAHSTYRSLDYPQHRVSFSVNNTGDLTMFNVSLFGIVQNHAGDTVDILVLDDSLKVTDLAAGESAKYELASLSKSGRCVGPADPSGYTLHYWLTFKMEDNQRITKHFTWKFRL